MSVKKFAREMREMISNMKSSGTAAIYCDQLIEYLIDVENSPEPEPTEVDLTRFKHDLQVANDTRKLQHESSIEMFRSVISAGLGAIRMTLLLNGGASIALLAFIGHLATCGVENCNSLHLKISEFSYSLLLFGCGAFAATALAGSTYLSQWCYSQKGNCMQNAGRGFNYLCIFLGLLSYVLFLIGLHGAYSAFAEL